MKFIIAEVPSTLLRPGIRMRHERVRRDQC
jgi:hypothetical protein